MAHSQASGTTVAWIPNFVDMEQTIVTLYVGLEEKSFTFHRSLLMEVSMKFKAQFEGEFEEGTSKILRLPREHSRTVAVFQNWLYSGYLTLPADSTANVQRWEATVIDDQGNEVPNQELGAPRCRGCNSPKLPQLEDIEEPILWQDDLLLLLQFADVHQIPLLTREVIITWQHMDEGFNSITPYEIINSAFDILPPEADFLKYLTEQYRFWRPTDWDNCGCDCGFEPTDQFPNPPSAADLPQAFTDKMKHEPVEAEYFDWCDFHEHHDDEEMGFCQQLRWDQGRFSKTEQFVQERIALMNYNPDEGMYFNNATGQFY